MNTQPTDGSSPFRSKGDQDAAARDVRAVILAAGQGSRLRPLTDDRPKCLVELAGKPLLDRHLDVLRSQGVEDIIVIGGYRADQLPREGVTVVINEDYATTNMVWTLFTAQDLLTAPLIVAYGDILYSPEVLRTVLEHPADITVAVDADWRSYWQARSEDPLADAETLRYKPDGTLAEIGQRPHHLDDIQGQYIGLMKFSSQGLATLTEHYQRTLTDPTLLPAPTQHAYMTDLLQSLISHGHAIHPAIIHNNWIEIDTHDDLAVAETRLATFTQVS